MKNRFKNNLKKWDVTKKTSMMLLGLSLVSAVAAYAMECFM